MRVKLEKDFGPTYSETEEEIEGESEDSSELNASMLVESANPADFDSSASKSVRIKNILNALRWKFSFEVSSLEFITGLLGK